MPFYHCGHLTCHQHRFTRRVRGHYPGYVLLLTRGNVAEQGRMFGFFSRSFNGTIFSWGLVCRPQLFFTIDLFGVLFGNGCQWGQFFTSIVRSCRFFLTFFNRVGSRAIKVFHGVSTPFQTISIPWGNMVFRLKCFVAQRNNGAHFRGPRGTFHEGTLNTGYR